MTRHVEAVASNPAGATGIKKDLLYCAFFCTPRCIWGTAVTDLRASKDTCHPIQSEDIKASCSMHACMPYEAS